MPKIPQEMFDELPPERKRGMWAAPKTHGKLPEQSYDANPARLAAALRVLKAAVPDGSSVIDLGCMYGAYTIEFARAGYEASGIEVRKQSVAMAKQAARRAGVRVKFFHDDVHNLENHATGPDRAAWDAVFCCGLLYHLNDPAAFLRLLGQVTRKLLIVQTHIAMTPAVEHEGYRGNWYVEGELTHPFSAWENTRSFWFTKNELTRALQDAGFPLVMDVLDVHADVRGSYDRVMLAAVRE